MKLKLKGRQDESDEKIEMRKRISNGLHFSK